MTAARRQLLVVAVLVASATTVFAQRGGGFGDYGRLSVTAPVPYDGRFVFVRMAYASGGGRGGSAWAHDYPDGEWNFLNILTHVSDLPAHTDASSVLAFDDPEMFKFPVIYLVEPGYWWMTDPQVVQLRDYLKKGGFLIVDDFPYWAWGQFDLQMSRAFPEGKWIDLDVTHPIFHSFFDIQTLDIVPAYPELGPKPIFRGLFEDNDPTKRMYVMANYQNDLSEFWEYSGRGRYVVDETNEAYKVGVNQFIYGLTH
jgi:SAM-dependent methyltransferase